VVAILDRDSSKHLSDLLHTRPDLLRPGVVLLPGEDLPPRDLGFRLVIIDTPPGFAALQSLQEAELVLVPVQPEDQGVLGLVRYLDGITRRCLVINPSLRLVTLLPTMVQHVALHEQRLEEIRLVAAEHEPPLRVLTPIPRRAHIARSAPNTTISQTCAHIARSAVHAGTRGAVSKRRVRKQGAVSGLLGASPRKYQV
jgi:hypothetical protein